VSVFFHEMNKIQLICPQPRFFVTFSFKRKTKTNLC
ncbi:MAG: hypothetical protein ACI81T_004388, partial [Bacteroidia bacterium]